MPLEEIMRQMGEEEGHAQCPPDGWEVHPGDDLWPEMVAEAANVGDVIYGVGASELMGEPCISIIGARRATPYGIAIAKLAGRVAAECGLVVVSGGALGCDAAASRAAAAAGGRTIIVSGCSAENVYPKTNRDVFEEARARGCVLSLAPWGTQPHRFAFPVRNRLIAGLSKVLVVCEASLPSGTFSTAQAASDLDRRIYAAPGSIFSPYSRGTNWLLEQGATIIVDDTSLELAISSDYDVARLVRQKFDDPERGAVLRSLIAEPKRADDLAEVLSMEVVTLIRTLADYEAMGLVTKLPDGCYAPTEAALLGAEDPMAGKRRAKSRRRVEGGRASSG